MVYVLCTRPLSATVIAEAAAKGVTIDVVPFIGITKLQDGEQTQEWLKRPITVIFTSSNAVTAVAPAPAAVNWKIFCISGATQQTAAERFGENAIVGTADSAKELAEKIIAESSEKEVCFFCGDRRREELPEMLKAAGFTVHELIVYKTILTPHRIEKRYDAIAFFSPSAVDSFFSVNTVDADVLLFAIGETTAAALRGKCPNPVLISERPDEKILVEQIIKNSQH